MSWTDLEGLAVLSRRTLGDPWEAGDSLFHEALHSKLVAILRQADVAAVDEDATPTRLLIPWRRGDDARWTTHRACDAFHVYGHLTVLWAARTLRAKEGRG